MAGIILFYYIFNPLQSRFMPQCAFHRLTGLSCPGCGTQRALHALLHGDIAAAFSANAFLIIISPLLMFLLWVELNRTRRPRIYVKVHNVAFIAVIAAMLIGWGVVRNIFGI